MVRPLTGGRPGWLVALVIAPVVLNVGGAVPSGDCPRGGEGRHWDSASHVEYTAALSGVFLRWVVMPNVTRPLEKYVFKTQD